MKTLLSALFVISILISCQPDKKKELKDTETSINIELQKQLEAIRLKDQGIRQLLDPNITDDKKQHLLDTLNISTDNFEEMKFKIYQLYDSANLAAVEQIIDEYGYPGKTLVGEPTNSVAFLVIQHNPDKIEEYLPIIKSAGEKGEIKMGWIAMMEDRYLMGKGEEQIYGTQIMSKRTENGEMIQFVWPIKNPDSVNILRKSVGFKSTLEEYVQRFGIEYKKYTLEEVNNF
jgi:hypothetical protein